MQVAISGGRGFIGEHLVKRHLLRGDRVRVLTRQLPPPSQDNVQYILGDLSLHNQNLTRFVDDADILYHCAAEVTNPTIMHAVNVDGTRALIDASQGRIGKWVHLSSVGAYGPVQFGRVTEEWKELPIGEYERSKTTADNLVRNAQMNADFPVVILRPSNVYSPKMTNRSLFQLIHAIDRGLFFFIGAAGAVANYVHVENVIDVLEICGNNQAALGQTYIVSDHRDLETFVSIIAAALGRKAPTFRLPESIARFGARLGNLIPGFPLTQKRIAALTLRATYSMDKLKAELGYKPRISMEEGLAEMVHAYKTGRVL